MSAACPFQAHRVTGPVTGKDYTRSHKDQGFTRHKALLRALRDLREAPLWGRGESPQHYPVTTPPPGSRSQTHTASTRAGKLPPPGRKTPPPRGLTLSMHAN